MTSQSMPALSRSHLKAPPRPPLVSALPLVGSLPRLLIDGPDYLVEARARYGDIFTLDLGLTKIIALAHPRHAQHVLRDRARNYSKGGAFWDGAREMLGNGLPVSEGDFWLRQRRMVQPQFHRERLAALAELMVQAIDESLASWEAPAASGQPMNVAQALTSTTMNVIVRTMFGTALTREEVEHAGVEVRYMFEYIGRGVITRGLPAWVPVPGARRFKEALQNVDRIISRMIERRRREGTDSKDLLSMLLNVADADTGERMTERQLRDEVIAIFIAGYETTASTMAWVFEALLHRPELAAEVADEVDAVLGERAPGFADARKLPLALYTVQEGLRLYPAAFWVPRTAVEDDEIDGFHIPAGATVAPVTYVIHRHPDFWDQPNLFVPRRFTPECSEKRHPLAWMPFGAGQRLCVGKDFALMEGQFILAQVLRRFRLEPVPGRVARPQLAATLRPKDGVWAKLIHRSPPARSAG